MIGEIVTMYFKAMAVLAFIAGLALAALVVGGIYGCEQLSHYHVTVSKE